MAEAAQVPVVRQHDQVGGKQDQGPPQVSQVRTLLQYFPWSMFGRCFCYIEIKFSHREAKDKLSIKAYGEKFRDYILEELGKVKGPVHIPLEVEQEKTFESVDRDVDIDDSPEKDREDLKEKVYSAEEWRALHKKKVTPRDRVTCDLCNKTMNRHSFTRHKEKAHLFAFNCRTGMVRVDGKGQSPLQILMSISERPNLEKAYISISRLAGYLIGKLSGSSLLCS